jgi:transcriptional regulator with XRE-family HTH domain
MRLRKIREDRGITQDTLARRAKISRVYLAQLERQRQDPSLSVVVRLARALKVKVGDLVD